MRVLVFGSLFPNEDRILAMKAAGHDVVYAHTVDRERNPDFERRVPTHDVRGPHMRRRVRELCSEHDTSVIYSLLNCYDRENHDVVSLLDDPALHVPIVRHYKEHRCIPNGAERRVLTETAAQIYINQHSLRHFRRVYGVSLETAYVADADRISERFMTNDFSPRLRERDGRPHVLVAGTITTDRGRHDYCEFTTEMARRDVHVHLFGFFLGGAPTAYRALAAASPRVHVHDRPLDRRWFTKVWSQYDAGVMHMRTGAWNEWMSFQELNYPYRLSAYLAAGLPLLQRWGGQRAMCDLVRDTGIGLVWDGYDELAERLRDDALMRRLWAAARARRRDFSYERDLQVVLCALEGSARP